MTIAADRDLRVPVVLAQAGAVATAFALERTAEDAVVRADPRILGSAVAADAGDWFESRAATGGVTNWCISKMTC